MARTVNIYSDSLIAASDLSSAQFTFVELDTTAGGSKATVPSAGGTAYGVLQDKPKSGQIGSVLVIGESPVVVGSGGVTAGDLIATDNAGKAVTAVSGNYILGRAKETAAAGAYCTVALQRAGKL